MSSGPAAGRTGIPRAAAVRALTTPVALRPFSRWNLRSAESVAELKNPATPPDSGVPALARACWSARTSSP